MIYILGKRQFCSLFWGSHYLTKLSSFKNAIEGAQKPGIQKRAARDRKNDLVVEHFPEQVGNLVVYCDDPDLAPQISCRRIFPVGPINFGAPCTIDNVFWW